MIKKILLLTGLLISCFNLVAQEIPTPKIEINKDKFDNPDGTYYVSFYKTTSCNATGTIEFDFYLSYKGKRVSDHYHMRFCVSGRHGTNAITWPDEVPKGHERYVTVQLGREPAKKDHRDND